MLVEHSPISSHVTVSNKTVIEMQSPPLCSLFFMVDILLMRCQISSRLGKWWKVAEGTVVGEIVVEGTLVERLQMKKW